MIVPNKIVKPEQSVLSLTPIIISRGSAPIPLLQLYQEVRRSFESVDQFIVAIDLLFVLGRIELDMDTGVVTYVGRD